MKRDLMTSEDWNDSQNETHDEEDIEAAAEDIPTAPFEDPFGPEHEEDPPALCRECEGLLFNGYCARCRQ